MTYNINISQRECVIQCQIMSSWVVTQPLPLAVETRLSYSSSSSPCSESLGTRLVTCVAMSHVICVNMSHVTRVLTVCGRRADRRCGNGAAGVAGVC